jgi:hypothetical protein
MRLGGLGSSFLGATLLAAGGAAGPALAAPVQLRGKAVVISWTEQRHERNPVTKQEQHINLPFGMTVYVSEKDQVFNRLSAGNRGASDQATGSKDRTAFAPRAVSFSGTRMTVSNRMTSGGARQISASFDASFSSCTGSVILGRSGSGPILQKRMGGGDVELLSATTGGVSCSVSAGNPFGGQ